MSQIINFGRNLGATFEQCLMKDLPYCQFIDRCPENDKIKEFKDWLKVNLPRGVEADQKKRFEAFQRRFS